MVSRIRVCRRYLLVFVCFTIPLSARVGAAEPSNLSDTTQQVREICGQLRSRGPDFQPLADTCEYALQLPRTLPNLVSVETVRRTLSPKHKPDIIKAELTVQRLQSHYANVTVNGKNARAGVSSDDQFSEQVTSTGEVAHLFDVFSQASHTDFASPVDAVIERRHLRRYDFRVKREDNVSWKWFFVGNGIYPGYHGSVYVDRGSGAVVRLVVEVTSSEVDPGTPVSQSTTTLDYGDVVIGEVGPQHVPLRGENVSCFRELLGCIRNELTFGDYHLFRAESRILPAE